MPARAEPARILSNDFPALWREVRKNATGAFRRVGASARFILGEEVVAFEQALASVWGLNCAVGVASGLDALEISLRILGCGPGDRVLTTPLSAFATTLAILKVGAVPVFADTTDQGLLDLAACRRILAESPGIRFLVPVHLYGVPLDLNELSRLRADFGLAVVEDCAQSILATWEGRPTGSVGDLAATSFYPTKNLGAMGDAGAILTNDENLAARAREFRDYGQSGRYNHVHLGYNSRLDELHAAILRDVCLPRLAGWTQRRREVANLYERGIQNAEIRVSAAPAQASGSGHLFPVFVSPDQRDALLVHLESSGIQGAIHYPVAIPDQPVMAGYPHELPTGCNTARTLCRSVVSLPIHPYLSDGQVAAVIAAVNAWRGGSVVTPAVR